MKWQSNYKSSDGYHFEIEEDGEAGFYFKVINSGGVAAFDYLQDSFDIATKQAKKDYGVPTNSWKKAGQAGG